MFCTPKSQDTFTQIEVDLEKEPCIAKHLQKTTHISWHLPSCSCLHTGEILACGDKEQNQKTLYIINIK